MFAFELKKRQYGPQITRDDQRMNVNRTVRFRYLRQNDGLRMQRDDSSFLHSGLLESVIRDSLRERVGRIERSEQIGLVSSSEDSLGVGELSESCFREQCQFASHC